MLLYELLEITSEKYAEKIAIKDKKQSITYKKLNSYSDEIAKNLRNQGCLPGSSVALYMEKSIEAVISIFGILKAGANYIPLDINSPELRNNYIIENAKIEYVITSTTNSDLIKKLVSSKPFCNILIVEYSSSLSFFVETFPANKEIFDQEEYKTNIDSSATAYVLYTSGSTGNPKGVVHTHDSALAFVNWAYEYFKINDDDVLSSHAPFNFDLSIFDIYVAVKAGATLCLIPKAYSSFPASLEKYIVDNNITTWYSVPSVLINLVKSDKIVGLSCLRRIIYAGEVFPILHLNKLIENLSNVEFYNLYGPTETNVITYYKLPNSIECNISDVPIGSACEFGEILVVDEEGNIVGKGEQGELVYKGDTMMSGYLNDPDSTDAAFRSFINSQGIEGRYYCTGDIVKVLENNEYLFIGRKDNIVKIKGFRIGLEEIETAFRKNSLLKDCVIELFKDEGDDNRIKAYVVLHTPINSKQILKHLKKYLPSYMLPDSIVILDEIPRNSRGKIDRKMLSKKGIIND